MLRNSERGFEGGRALWYPRGLDALMMEALACRDGIQLARSKGVSKLLVETDCEMLAKLWEKRTFMRSHIALILSEMLELSTSFTDFSLMYAPRSCNRVAYLLCKQVTGDDRLGEWQIAPTCIDRLLAEDCNPDIQ
ncbi:unnamed protein product [Miscanthus lutarioriparius]|uniref:RNase H type-1 domain-containing protein n=1 Tax=Miscanthus lutarioriparius TaxID=422564 RepID=A0A811SD08_9POAL|nr:unnamed protein product [Miscanthus lutarioriparius]